MNHADIQSTNGHETSGGMSTVTTLLSAATITGDEVCDMQDKSLGKIQDLMLDLAEGRIRCAALASGYFWVWVIAYSLFGGRH